MRIVAFPIALVACAIAVTAASGQRDPSAVAPPAWAYPVNPPAAPGAQPPPDDGLPKHVPGSSAAFTLKEIRDLFNPPDWHPDDHPPAPEIVAYGRRPDVRACGYCHLPNGQGRPENSSLAGLPPSYIVQQMADFKSGARKSAEPKMGPPAAMIAVAKASTDAEWAQAAEYFAAVPYRAWIRVVEAASVPKVRVSGSMYVPVPEGGTEPIRQRIVETPEDVARTELRDSASGFVAYVPPGSVKAGAALVAGGGGKTLACGTCHGADLKGLGPVPGLAGRSPSYLARQLFDFQQGVRHGPWSPLMKAAVAKLTEADLVAIAAYTAAQKP